MKALKLALFALLLASAAFGQTITTEIIITNKPTVLATNGLTFNGVYLAWTNARTSTTIDTNGVVDVNYAATNLYAQMALYTPNDAVLGRSRVQRGNTNSIKILGPPGLVPTISSFGSNYFRWVFTTNGSGNVTNIATPASKAYPVAVDRTNIYSSAWSDMVNYGALGTAVPTNDPRFSNYHGLGNYPQTALGLVTLNQFQGTNAGIVYIGIYQGATNINPRIDGATSISGIANNITNGIFWVPITVNQWATNLKSFSGFSAPGTNTEGEQFGQSAYATNYAVAVGTHAIASGDSSVAVGGYSEASGWESATLGGAATAWASMAIGAGSLALASNGIAIGTGSSVTHANAGVIGINAVSSDTNQLTLMSASDKVFIPGRLITGTTTNSTLTGITTNQHSIVFPTFAVSTLANGNNIAAPLSNTFVVVSGPSAAFAVCGIQGGINGRLLHLVNGSGQTLTVSHESGVDPTPANRIRLSSAADATFSDGGSIDLWWDSSISRWRGNIPVAVATNAIATLNGIGTNLVLWSSSLQNIPLTLNSAAGMPNTNMFQLIRGTSVFAGFDSNGIPFMAPSNSAKFFPASGRIAIQNADTITTNSVAETAIILPNVGSTNLDAGTFDMFKVIDIYDSGEIWLTSGTTKRFFVRVGGNQASMGHFTVGGTVAQARYELRSKIYVVTKGASGQIRTEGSVLSFSANGVNFSCNLTNTTVNMNLTTNIDLSVAFTAGATTDSVISKGALIEGKP